MDVVEALIVLELKCMQVKIKYRCIPCPLNSTILTRTFNMPTDFQRQSRLLHGFQIHFSPGKIKPREIY